MQRPPWTDRYKPNWDDAYRRVMAWWAGDGLDRPVILSPVTKPGAPEFTPSHDPSTAAARDLDERYRLEAERHMLEWSLFPAESAPAVMTRYGSLLCMLGSMAGAETLYTPETGTAWIGEIGESLFDRDLPQFNPANPAYAFAIHMIARHHAEFGFDCILGANPMLDPLTTVSMMRGPQALCLDLLDRPDTVRRWVRRLGDMLLEIFAGYRAARAAVGRREEMNWTGMWSPGDMDALQCDFSTMLSREMFNEFAMPELERQAELLDYAMWHLDGTDEIRHLDSILSVKKVTAIQWVHERGRPAMEMVEVFQRIQRAGRSVLLTAAVTVDEAVALAKALDKGGLALRLSDVRTESEMERALKRLSAV